MKQTVISLIFGCTMLCYGASGQTGIINTVAGGGADYPGDGGPATSAYLPASPGGIAVDASGNLYIADSGDARVRKVDRNGIITTVAGNGTNGFSGDGGPATSASLYLNSLCGLAVDVFGNLFIADVYNYRVRKVSPGGIITTVAGNGTQGFSGDGGLATSASLNEPLGIAVSASGNLFIADYFSGRIRQVSPSGVIYNFPLRRTLSYRYCS